MKSAGILVLAAVCALAAAGVVAAQGTPQRNAAPDAFYLSLLRDGKAELLRGDAVAAKKSFRLACFGFLEQPVILAEGLVRLSLAEVALADREAFVTTFSRLAEVEEHFAAYAPAALSNDERRRFEDQALAWVAPEMLRGLPGFAALLARKSELELAKLAPRERLRELEKRAAAERAAAGPTAAEPTASEPTTSESTASESNAAHWRVLLAQDEAANDRMAKVLTQLDGVPDAAEDGAAGCLRGRALARLKRCAEAMVALAACATGTSDPQLAEAQLNCLLALERPDAARQLAARITPPAADAPAVRKAIAHIAPPLAPEARRSPAKEGAPPPARAPKRTPELTPELTPDEGRAIATARGMLKSGDKRDELARGLALVRPIADRLPGRSDLQLLAGEIAYRSGQWASGAEYFRRSTPDRGGPIDPTQRFYLAVCLYEAGDRAGAAQVAATGLEKLPRPPFVQSYLQKIRAPRP